MINSQNSENDPAVTDQPYSSDADYRVGPGHPPLETRFKKGGASPNPKGRPRKNATVTPDLKRALEDALNKKVKVKRGDTQISLTAAVLGIEQLVTQYAKGDRHARRDLMDVARQLGVDLHSGQKEKIQDVLSPGHQAILDAYVARQSPFSVSATPQHVIAPPELLDGVLPERRLVRRDIKRKDKPQ